VGVDVYLYTFLTWHYMEVCHQPHSLDSLPLANKHLETAWMCCSTGKSLASTENKTIIPCQPMAQSLF
jgi:hypothetical protein